MDLRNQQGLNGEEHVEVRSQLQAQRRHPQTLAGRLARAPVVKALQSLVTFHTGRHQAQSEHVNREVHQPHAEETAHTRGKQPEPRRHWLVLHDQHVRIQHSKRVAS
eukprot:8121878-Pyramimonas_sp.AAC.1